MPRVTIWVREEDMAAWESIKDRPKFLHKILNLPAIKKQIEEENKKEVHYEPVS